MKYTICSKGNTTFSVVFVLTAFRHYYGGGTTASVELPLSEEINAFMGAHQTKRIEMNEGYYVNARNEKMPSMAVTSRLGGVHFFEPLYPPTTVTRLGNRSSFKPLCYKLRGGDADGGMRSRYDPTAAG